MVVGLIRFEIAAVVYRPRQLGPPGYSKQPPTLGVDGLRAYRYASQRDQWRGQYLLREALRGSTPWE